VSAGQRLEEPLGAPAPDRLYRRLAWWTVVVAFMSIIAYAAHFNGDRPPKDVAYRWESSIAGAAQYAILFGIVLLLTWGLDRRRFLALRPPASWWRAAGLSAIVIFVVFVVTAVVAQFGNADEEQGLIPESFDSSRAAQFAAYAAVVVVVAPIVEELLFRGAGYGLLEPFGRTPAIVLVGIAFALVHGLVIGFPVIATFGIGLAFLRARTASIYPCILLHASFNAFGLAVGIAS
jgi:membrane protease YdiL (CAAX protease family)